MPLLNPSLIAAALAIQGKLAYGQTHYDDPGMANTSNVNTGTRSAPSWSTPTDTGNWNLAAPLSFTGIAANNAVTWITFWDSLSGGVCTGKYPIGSGDEVANASGQWQLTTAPFTGAAT